MDEHRLVLLLPGIEGLPVKADGADESGDDRLDVATADGRTDDVADAKPQRGHLPPSR
jgi:hypothetical protein